MTDDEIQGILAHISNGDTQRKLLLYVASTVYLYAFILLELGLEFIRGLFSDNFFKSLIGFLHLTVSKVIGVVITIGVLISAGSNRKNGI